MDWDDNTHFYRMGSKTNDKEPVITDVLQYKRDIEPWLSAVFQSEHFSLLLGSGFTSAVANLAGARQTNMNRVSFGLGHPLLYEDLVNIAADKSAVECDRGISNIEDQIRSAMSLIEGLRITQDPLIEEWTHALNRILRDLLESVLTTEVGILKSVQENINEVEQTLVSFLLSFASRTASRERLNVFTTNYDRLAEYGCDLVGLRTIDRFVGTLTPLFRSSRIAVDMHYNPPGIRGEPRYLEGVVRLTKLHGSLDWRFENKQLKRYGIPFGAPTNHSDFSGDPLNSIMIYPNPAKDVETLLFPYAELFRDFSSALCRPNSALVIYGYGFGDDHINRVIADMLSISSTHLVIISWDHAGGRLESFLKKVGRQAQISLLVGHHYGDIKNLVNYYLPKPSIDDISIRRAALEGRRSYDTEPDRETETGSNDE